MYSISNIFSFERKKRHQLQLIRVVPDDPPHSHYLPSEAASLSKIKLLGAKEMDAKRLDFITHKISSESNLWNKQLCKNEFCAILCQMI